MGSGIHIVWGIYRIFNLYVCEEENSFYLRFVIWSWYLGAIIGSSAAGYVIATIRKSHIYVCTAIFFCDFREKKVFFTHITTHCRLIFAHIQCP